MSNIFMSGAASHYELESEYVPIPGSAVSIVLEFPEIGPSGKSVIFHLDDAMTVSFSVYRSKVRVIPLGRNEILGYGLGTRLVAGSMIRSVFSTDKLSKLQEDVYAATQEELQARLLGINGKIPKGLPKQDTLALMKDDLTSFNIHIVTQTEDLVQREDGSYAPYSRYEVILGCIMMNTGQVYSIEDLITESTFSFEAKSVKTITNLNKNNYSTGFSSGTKVRAVSDLLGGV